MIQGLRTIAYHVPEAKLDEAKAWYTAVTGKPPYFDMPFYVGFNVGGYELGLQPSGTNGAGGTVAYWGTADCHAEVARLESIGAVVTEPVQDVGDGILVATMKDPWGNLVGVIQNPHFKLES